MTKNEVFSLLQAVKKIWASQKDDVETIDIWYRVLKPIEKAEASNALLEVMQTNEKWPPKPADIFNRCQTPKAEQIREFLENNTIRITTHEADERGHQKQRQRYYCRAKKLDLWKQRKEYFKRGFGLVVKKLNEYDNVLQYYPLHELEEIGVDTMGNEELPKYELSERFVR
jgi:hypothetical protein